MLQTQDFYSEIKELAQILLRISEEKIGGWGLWSTPFRQATGPGVLVGEPGFGMIVSRQRSDQQLFCLTLFLNGMGEEYSTIS